MSTPTPLTSFIGGVGLALPSYTLMMFNGSVFGISGFVHRAIQGNKEAIIACTGLVLGGMTVGAIEGRGPTSSSLGLPGLVLSGFLVGMGTKASRVNISFGSSPDRVFEQMSNGCTSGHMLAGLARFSKRSFAATATFFSTAVITTRLLHFRSFAPVKSSDWSVHETDKTLLAVQTLPVAVSAMLMFAHILPSPGYPTGPEGSREGIKPPRKFARAVALLSTTVEFALALRLSNLTNPNKVSTFLLLPTHSAFDPSLAFLALGALPIGSFLYHSCRGSETPLLGGKWAIPKPAKIDMKLLVGAALFGVGWGGSGFCPGPVLINFGRAVATGSDFSQWLAWLCAFIAGGLVI